MCLSKSETLVDPKMITNYQKQMKVKMWHQLLVIDVV